MRIHTSLATAADPEASLPKVVAYKVAPVGQPGASDQAKIDATKSGEFAVGDAQAFVHRWFQHIDEGDAEALVAMTSEGPLAIDIMGNSVDNRDDLGAFLKSQGDAQDWSAHIPHNIHAAPFPDGFDVQFVLHFQGDVTGAGFMTLSNVTQWKLVAEGGQLRLRDYTLNVL